MKNAVNHAPGLFQLNNVEIEILISGIGILNTTYSLMDYLTTHKPDAWIQAGIGGAFDRSLEIGEVYLIESEMLMDYGAQDKDGRIINQFELGWANADEFPFSDGKMLCPYISSEISIPFASGMTSIHSHGFQETIDRIDKGLHGQVESMEGAAFFYVSLMKNIPFLSLRSISNFVESRDTSKWNIPLAINIINAKLITLLKENSWLDNWVSKKGPLGY